MWVNIRNADFNIYGESKQKTEQGQRENPMGKAAMDSFSFNQRHLKLD